MKANKAAVEQAAVTMRRVLERTLRGIRWETYADNSGLDVLLVARGTCANGQRLAYQVPYGHWRKRQRIVERVMLRRLWRCLTGGVPPYETKEREA